MLIDFPVKTVIPDSFDFNFIYLHEDFNQQGGDDRERASHARPTADTTWSDRPRNSRAIDGKVVRRADWAATPLSDGMEITVISAVCGG